ncbi:hypothetical protein KEM48_000550 [Puccinia striiformis f. sp. tritici PST-130]|nr:hypothetical protein KEM48_000550 [Puccinia striiformis f. sp. tritici PST-130]
MGDRQQSTTGPLTSSVNSYHAAESVFARRAPPPNAAQPRLVQNYPSHLARPASSFQLPNRAQGHNMAQILSNKPTQMSGFGSTPSLPPSRPLLTQDNIDERRRGQFPHQNSIVRVSPEFNKSAKPKPNISSEAGFLAWINMIIKLGNDTANSCLELSMENPAITKKKSKTNAAARSYKLTQQAAQDVNTSKQPGLSQDHPN